MNYSENEKKAILYHTDNCHTLCYQYLYLRLDHQEECSLLHLYIDAAVELYKAGKINYILISGDNRKEEYNEPEEMKKALMQKGVPEKSIYLDYAGFRTLDSVVRAKEVFGQTRLTIISQRFHNERAIYLAEKNGITAIGFNARDVDVYAGLKTNIRELFARVKMFIDLAIDKQPHFLGEKYKLPSGK